MSTENSVAMFESAREDLERLRSALEGVIVGQSELVGELLIAVMAGGHVLLEGLPGLGKTHLAKGIAAALDLALSRIQCTPDLMPADITGSEVMTAGSQDRYQLEFRKGPVFSSMVLVDEINRATPRTQAALLEAMQERQVTYAGQRFALPEPFWVLATQNPIELEGTYPLPEAQLDRFLFKLRVPYPDPGSLQAILDVSLDEEPSEHLAPVIGGDRLVEIMATAREVIVAEPVRRRAADLILATQPDQASRPTPANRHLRYGASPRGLQALVRAARVIALFDGRAHAAEEDLERAALPALRHRILLNVESELDGHNTDEVLALILDHWRETR